MNESDRGGQGKAQPSPDDSSANRSPSDLSALAAQGTLSDSSGFGGGADDSEVVEPKTEQMAEVRRENLKAVAWSPDPGLGPSGAEGGDGGLLGKSSGAELPAAATPSVVSQPPETQTVRLADGSTVQLATGAFSVIEVPPAAVSAGPYLLDSNRLVDEDGEVMEVVRDWGPWRWWEQLSTFGRRFYFGAGFLVALGTCFYCFGFTALAIVPTNHPPTPLLATAIAPSPTWTAVIVGLEPTSAATLAPTPADFFFSATATPRPLPTPEPTQLATPVEPTSTQGIPFPFPATATVTPARTPTVVTTPVGSSTSVTSSPTRAPATTATPSTIPSATHAPTVRPTSTNSPTPVRPSPTATKAIIPSSTPIPPTATRTQVVLRTRS